MCSFDCCSDHQVSARYRQNTADFPKSGAATDLSRKSDNRERIRFREISTARPCALSCTVSVAVYHVALSRRRSRVRFPYGAPNLNIILLSLKKCIDGGVAQRDCLQNSKTAGSNPARCSIFNSVSQKNVIGFP